MFQELAHDIRTHIRESMPEWRGKSPGVEALEVAVMGRIVDGPGESKPANVGLSLPGTGEASSAPVFVDGEKVAGIAEEFKAMVGRYIEERWGRG